ncbi:bromodomain-containing protein [Cryptosporidium serpentis]
MTENITEEDANTREKEVQEENDLIYDKELQDETIEDKQATELTDNTTKQSENLSSTDNSATIAAAAPEIKIPRGRGRPPRNLNKGDVGLSGLVGITSIWADDDKPKGKRGRPRIRPLEIEESVEVKQNKPLKVKRPRRPNEILLEIVRRLYKRDRQQIFAEPVNAELVPDYYQVIKNPMDFSTMRNKVIQEEYKDFESFESDIRLIITNCYTYNRIGTLVYRMGLILEETWDKSKEASRNKYLQSFKNIEEYEEKKRLGEIESDSEAEPQPIWTPTPTSPPAQESPNPSNHRSMITRRMETRLSSSHSPWLLRNSDRDSSNISDINKRSTNHNIYNQGGVNSSICNNKEVPTVSALSPTLPSQSKGPTLADICRADTTGIKENLERLRADKVDPFSMLLKQLVTQPCIKTPTVDDWYIFDKQLPFIQYRESVSRFIGQESIQLLKSIMDIDTALMEIDPYPAFMKYPLNDIRLLGIDTDDFVQFNSSLSVDGSFLLGVGENHIKLALTLQDEYPDIINLSPLRELVTKYTQHPLLLQSNISKYPKYTQSNNSNSNIYQSCSSSIINSNNIASNSLNRFPQNYLVNNKSMTQTNPTISTKLENSELSQTYSSISKTDSYNISELTNFEGTVTSRTTICDKHGESNQCSIENISDLQYQSIQTLPNYHSSNIRQAYDNNFYDNIPNKVAKVDHIAGASFSYSGYDRTNHGPNVTAGNPHQSHSDMTTLLTKSISSSNIAYHNTMHDSYCISKPRLPRESAPHIANNRSHNILYQHGYNIANNANAGNKQNDLMQSKGILPTQGSINYSAANQLGLSNRSEYRDGNSDITMYPYNRYSPSTKEFLNSDISAYYNSELQFPRGSYIYLDNNSSVPHIQSSDLQVQQQSGYQCNTQRIQQTNSKLQSHQYIHYDNPSCPNIQLSSNQLSQLPYLPGGQTYNMQPKGGH